MFSAFLILFKISLYLKNMLWSSISKDMFFPKSSEFITYPLKWGKTMHKDLMILSSRQPIKYLGPLSLWLNLSDIIMLPMSIKFKAIGFSELQYYQILVSFHSSLYCRNNFFLNYNNFFDIVLVCHLTQY